MPIYAKGPTQHDRPPERASKRPATGRQVMRARTHMQACRPSTAAPVTGYPAPPYAHTCAHTRARAHALACARAWACTNTTKSTTHPPPTHAHAHTCKSLRAGDVPEVGALLPPSCTRLLRSSTTFSYSCTTKGGGRGWRDCATKHFSARYHCEAGGGALAIGVCARVRAGAGDRGAREEGRANAPPAFSQCPAILLPSLPHHGPPHFSPPSAPNPEP